MTFINAEIPFESVPRAEVLQLRPIERDFMKVKIIQWMIFWLVIIVAGVALFFFAKPMQQFAVLIPTAMVLILLATFHFYVLRKSVAFKAYAIREHDVVYRTGWLVRSVKVVPFNRIQHCSVDEGAIARKFGLSSVRVFTSGGNDADVRIPGIKAAFAADLRELIISKTRQHGGNI